MLRVLLAVVVANALSACGSSGWRVQWGWPPLHIDKGRARPAASNPEPASTQQQQADIARLLALGDLALAKDRLTSPVNDNALLYYRQVLAIESGNEAARDGIDRVVERCMKLARRAHANGEESKMRNWLRRAQEAGGDTPELQSLRAELQQSPSGQNPRALRLPALDLRALQEKNR